MTKKDDDYILEEYKTVCREIEYQRKVRDYFTVITLSSGLTILGFSYDLLKGNNDLGIYLSILSLVIFILGYMHHVTRWLLGLKADSYIQYYFASLNESFRWHIRKAGYELGSLFHIYRCVVPLLYFSTIAGNLYLIYTNNPIIFCFSLSIILFIFIITTYSYTYSLFYYCCDPNYFIKKWKSQDAKVKAKIERWEKLES